MFQMSWICLPPGLTTFISGSMTVSPPLPSKRESNQILPPAGPASILHPVKLTREAGADFEIRLRRKDCLVKREGRAGGQSFLCAGACCLESVHFVSGQLEVRSGQKVRELFRGVGADDGGSDGGLGHLPGESDRGGGCVMRGRDRVKRVEHGEAGRVPVSPGVAGALTPGMRLEGGGPGPTLLAGDAEGFRKLAGSEV